MSCPICGRQVPYAPWDHPNGLRVECRVCGTFRISEYVVHRLMEAGLAAAGQRVPATNHHLMSAVIRDLCERGADVFITDLAQLRASAVPLDSLMEAVERVVAYVARKTPRIGDPVELRPAEDYPVAYARDGQEFNALVKHAVDAGLLDLVGRVGADQLVVRPTLQGWQHTDALRRQEFVLWRAFVAMAFNDEMKQVFTEAFEPALSETGYEPVRVDLIQHNDKVDDLIIAEIRKSGLVVADFTGQRPNVYYEAGFARGLGRHVISTVRDGEEKLLHFDTRQYNHIVWRDAADLREQLRLRIEATLPTRPATGATDGLIHGAAAKRTGGARRGA